MDRKRAERFTSPAIAAAMIVAGIVVVLRPGAALLVLAGAEAIAAAGCAMLVRTTLRRTPPAPSAAVLFAVKALFWAAMAALSVQWYAQGR
jgi:hypothetical protein